MRPQDLTWFSTPDGTRTFGVSFNLSPRAIADVLSAEFPVPLRTDAILQGDVLAVGNLTFTKTEQPKEPWKFTQIYPNAGVSHIL